MAPPRYDFGTKRRRGIRVLPVLIALLALLIGLFVWLGMRETSEPQQKIEQDVTNEVLK